MIYLFCDHPSRSCHILRKKIKELGYRARRLYVPHMGFRHVPGTVFNWGSLRCPVPSINPPEAIAKAVSKVECAKFLDEGDVPHIRISTDKQQADRWVRNGHKVLVRRDALSEGRGIRIYEGQDLGPGEFFTRVFPKTHEFRIHVIGDRAVDFAQKKSTDRLPHVGALWRLIRNYHNGWVFAHNDLVCNQEDKLAMEDLAKRAIKALGLTFGAVDLLATFNKETPRRLSRAVICEVNTRPGLENTCTIDAYARGIIQIAQGGLPG
jgi:hypothetical protein